MSELSLRKCEVSDTGCKKVGRDGLRWGGKADLGKISVTVETEPMMSDNVTECKHIDYEEQWAKDRSLRDTLVKGSRRSVVSNINELA